MVIVIIFVYIHEAYIAQTKLELKGIDFYLKDDIMATNYLLAVGGVNYRLTVRIMK